MKSKVFGFKILFVMLAVLTAGLCFGVGVKPKNIKPVVAQSTKINLGEDGAKEDYSALFDGNVIFSAEKVYIAKDEETTFSAPYHTFIHGREGTTYKFKDIENANSTKSVVDNGEFVVLRNTTDGANNFISSPGATTQEALMISFGAYYFDQSSDDFTYEGEEVKIHSEEAGAKITWLEVSVYKDGNPIKNDVVTREYLDNSAYYDFVYLLNQKTAEEGYYNFVFTYMINQRQYSGEFEFYLIYEASYTQSLIQNIGYSAKPTLGWLEDANDTNFEKKDSTYRIGNVAQYNVAENLTYPTITYDYTKYKLRYTHSANRINTTWEFDWRVKPGGGAEFIYTSTLRDVVKSDSMALNEYDAAETVNLVTIVLTEPGNYTVEYEAYYSGYNSDVAPTNIGIMSEVLKCNISGLIANYSKANQNSARFDYYEIANNVNQVGVFVPNGYNVDKGLADISNEDVGFAYKFVESNSARDGAVEKEVSCALANSKFDGELKNETSQTYGLITAMAKNLKTDPNATPTPINLNAIENMQTTLFDVVDYASTNQASIWLSGNDKASDDSFYIYSATKPFVEKGADITSNVFESSGGKWKFADGVAKKYTNSTSFNKTGYYLVFIEVDTASKYWQVFAFQYTSASVNINVQAITNKTGENTETQVIEGGAFTNKNVQISWKIPGVFDRDIQASYFMSLNKTLSSRNELLKTTEKEFKSVVKDNGYFKTELGADVQEETFVQYLIRLVDEEDSATYKIFTIDRQSISGVKPYLVQELYFGNSVYYALAADDRGDDIWISNSITDSMATLMWDKKESGASISATYSYIPFNLVKKESILEHKKDNSIVTNYQLGTEVNKSYTPVENVTNVSSQSIMSAQGIYLFKIVDAAGNGCLFMFVIDKTENYFEITLGTADPDYVKNELVVYGQNVGYNIGESKLVELDFKEDSDTMLKKLVSDFANPDKKEIGDLTKDGEFKYYQGKNNNFESIKKLFRKIGDTSYLNVKNMQVVAYDLDGVKDEKIPSDRLSWTLTDADKKDGESYYKRILYAVGDNHTFTTLRDKQLSRVTIEINTDNSQLFIHYGDGTLNPKSERLNTGSDEIIGDGLGLGLKYAQATSIDNIAITWKTGSGKYEVGKVTLKKYQLDLQQYDEKSYFYNETLASEAVEIQSSAQSTDEEGRVLYQIPKGSGSYLYVVTRTYKEAMAGNENFGKDVGIKNYYFIVDDSDIIDKNNQNGGLIELDFLENEASFTGFTTAGSVPIHFSDSRYGLMNKIAYLYITSNKVPATLKVPAGKFDRYLDGEGEDICSSSGYRAGKLNVQIFYMNDEKNPQLKPDANSVYRGGNVMLYDSEMNLDADKNVKVVDGYIEIDIEACIDNSYAKQRLVGNYKSWMFLPGDYIIRIYDKVFIDEQGNTNEKFIAFRVAYGNKGPNGEEYAKVDVSNGFNNENKSDVKTIALENVGQEEEVAYTATVSQEYLEVMIPKYNDKEPGKPMIDNEFLEIVQINNGNRDPEYFIYNSKADYSDDKTGKYIASTSSEYAYGIKLDTMLRDKDGKIILDNLSKDLRYEISVRYKISGAGEAERYKDCYVYYDDKDNKVWYYSAKIIIVIDRQAPTINIEELNKRDAFVEMYVGEHKKDIETVETITENNIIDASSYVYFNHQYSAYYRNDRKNKGYIYAYQVDANTRFQKGDIVKVYRRQIVDVSTDNLTLPFVASNGYEAVNEDVLNSKEELTYGNILINKSAGYYEIIEQDSAGNTTQYVVHYMTGNQASIEIPVRCLFTNAEEQNIDLSITSELTALQLYDISALTEDVIINDYNFVIQLEKESNDGLIYELLTTPTTNFKLLSTQVVDKIKKYGFGSYRLTIKARQVLDDNDKNKVNVVEKSFILNWFDAQNVKTIKIEDLIENTSEGYKLFFNKALVKDEEIGLVYYATKIEIRSQSSDEAEVFVGEYNFDAKVLQFRNSSGEEVSTYKFENEDYVYQISMFDVLGGEPTRHRFSPSGTEFYKVEFGNPDSDAVGDWGNYYFVDDKGVYYGYTKARVYYAPGIFTATLKIGNKEENYNSGDVLTPDYDDGLNEEFMVIIKDSADKVEKEYKISICSNLGNVKLRDYLTSEDQNVLVKQNNLRFDNNKLKSEKSLTGIMNLQWDILEHDILTYQYILHEVLADGSYRMGEDGTEGIKLEPAEGQKTGNYTVNTKSDSAGIYVFEIRVYAENGTYLGNRLYAFEVQKANDKVYYVRDDVENKAIIHNSTFSLSELVGVPAIDGMKNDIDYPLYVSSTPLTVVPVGSLVVTEEVYTDYAGFTINKISREKSFNLFIGILIIEQLERVKGVQIVAPNINEQVLTNTEYSVTNHAEKGISNDVKLCVEFEESYEIFEKKNKLFLDVYYEDVLVRSHELVDNDDTSNAIFVYTQQGNGKFSYVVRDLAGNTFKYKNEKNTLSVFILREIILKLNGQVPVQNGYYNDSVRMEIFEKENYVPGSIAIKIKFNGEELTNNSLENVFTQYGTYRISVSAKYTNHKNEEIPLTKEVVFTLLNKREVARSVDLSCLGKCEIVKVLNNNGVDVTEAFMAMLNSSNEGLNITYDLIMKHSAELGVSAGKLNFDVTYKIKDGVYPDRTHTLGICLNNEEPSIDCSLKSGEKSTKGFTITYNGAILYQQIGEAEIKINGKTVATIDEGSANAVSKIKKSFKASGAGDYYIQIVSSSGEVWESFRVTIKEPLNAWAIVVIVVVVLVVVAVVVTIIVLRRKMRIR